MGERILVVEDETTLGANIARSLDRAGHVATLVETGRAAIEAIEREAFDLVISDLRLPDIDGLSVLDQVKSLSPETVVLIMTAYASVDSAVEALRRGAQDYMLKPLSLAELQRRVSHLAEHRRLGVENARLRSIVRGPTDPVSMLRAGGTAMRAVCELLDRVAPSTSTVLITGESGVGKEVVARAVHDLSTRRDGPFVSLNVSAIPDSLVESYLFGHERGAFTGADRRREGLFRTASGGTLFLDEIGELSTNIQAKLLRAVETKEVLPVGSDRPIKVDARIVAATHRDLNQLADEEKFRRDLLYRLSVIQVRVPPLRERREDIPSLAEALILRHSKEQRKTVSKIEPEAIELLQRYSWGGNVRELSNVIERAVLLCDGDKISAADLPLELSALNGDTHMTETTSRPPAPEETTQESEENLELARAVLSFERRHIAKVLTRTGGNREAAARLLGLSPATLYRHLQRVGLKGFRSGEPPAEQ
ncbi:MAG: sigma-54 dependent transcriptional regulator [Polyangiaceae bacterium]